MVHHRSERLNATILSPQPQFQHHSLQHPITMYKIAQRNEAAAKVKRQADKIRKTPDHSPAALNELRQLMIDYLMIDYSYQMSEFWCNYSLDRLILEYNRLSGKRIRIY